MNVSIYSENIQDIYFSLPKTIKTWTTKIEIIKLHWINSIIRNNKCIFTKLNAVFILKTAVWTKTNITWGHTKVLLTFKLLKLFHKPVVLVCDILMLYSKFIKFTTYEIVFIEKFSTGFSFMRHLIHEIWCDTYFDVIVERMSEVRKGTSRNTKNGNKRHKYI
jgi:hypothetical protein